MPSVEDFETSSQHAHGPSQAKCVRITDRDKDKASSEQGLQTASSRAGPSALETFCLENERAAAEKTYAVVIGCNYPKSKGMRIWGACADARAWARALTTRIGLRRENVAVLTDESSDGTPKLESDETYPSQWNILKHLGLITSEISSGGLLVFIFCGRGTLIPENAEDDDDDDINQDTLVEEGLLCADFEYSDMVRGYSMRMITTRIAAESWEQLPAGASLVVVADCEHGASIVPVPRRLDAASLAPNARFDRHPPVKFGVFRTLHEVKQQFREESLSGTPDVDPNRAHRDSKNIWPKKRWLRIQMLGSTGGENELDLDHVLHPAVQAFSLTACDPGGHAFEAIMDGGSGGTRGKGGPAGRRGVLTHCLLRALEEMSFRGTYYDLWWRAVQILRSKNIIDQHFQLGFSEIASPMTCEVFEPLSAAAAMAYANQVEVDYSFFDDGFVMGTTNCSCTSIDGQPSVSALDENEYLNSAFNEEGDDPCVPKTSEMACGCDGNDKGDFQEYHWPIAFDEMPTGIPEAIGASPGHAEMRMKNHSHTQNRPEWSCSGSNTDCSIA
mmetsp:Transcript_89947/g.142127  ORF Transcript_89947/g.142127 Transcript_89947/m.142127 type:complete len:559 (+) Transcript_89947:48-1724(+)